MTDNEIIKEATEAYRQDLDAGCYVGDLLGIITRKNEEIERITLEYAGFKAGVNHFADIGKMLYNEARAEAIREFAQRLHENARVFFENHEAGWNCATLAVETEDIDNLVKEMTERQP